MDKKDPTPTFGACVSQCTECSPAEEDRSTKLQKVNLKATTDIWIFLQYKSF